MSDFLENNLIDWFFRAQAIGVTGASAAAGTGPANLYIGLFTANPTDAAGGTEVTGNAYARVGVASSLANWAGTQGAGTTAASSGTSGTTSNNGAVAFPTPTPSGWGTVTGVGIFDASTGGNLLIWAALTASKTINAGDSVSFPAGSLSFQIDN
jgi:hypothetical protein